MCLDLKAVPLFGNSVNYTAKNNVNEFVSRIPIIGPIPLERNNKTTQN